MDRFSVFILTISAVSAACGQILFKIGAHGRTNIIEFINIPILAGFIFYGIGMVLWIYALSFEKLVNVYAFTVLTFALVYLGGVVIVNEVITLGGIVGVFFVLGGLYIISVYGS